MTDKNASRKRVNLDSQRPNLAINCAKQEAFEFYNEIIYIRRVSTFHSIKLDSSDPSETYFSTDNAP